MARNFKLLVSLTKQPKEETVFQKQDGQRFTVGNTIKLNVNTTYTVGVQFLPQRQLNRLQIQGERQEFVEVKPDRDDDDSCKYQASWTTEGFQHTKSSKRKEVPFVIEMMDGVTMKVTLQCKFYPEGETEHCHWGHPLHNIEYDCLVPEGCSFVDVTRTKYL